MSKTNNEDRGFNTVNNSSLTRRDQRLKLQKMTLLLIGALMVLMVVTLAVLIIGYFVSSGSTNNPNNPGGQASKDKVIWATQTVSTADTVKGDLIIVNSTHQYTFPADTAHLTKVYSVSKPHDAFYKQGDVDSIETNTLYAVDRMLVDMANATGFKTAVLADGYRSFEAQEALGTSTKGGYSDHHTGRLCALNIKDEAAKAWINDNAAKYGFVVRYPDDKADKTGVSGYTFAYRYVGVAHATYMTANHLCLEEYIEYLKANVTDKKPLTVTGADGRVYEIYYYAVNGSADVKYPKNFAYTISGTNDGGVIVTVDRSATVTEASTENAG